MLNVICFVVLRIVIRYRYLSVIVVVVIVYRKMAGRKTDLEEGGCLTGWLARLDC